MFELGWPGAWGRNRTTDTGIFSPGPRLDDTAGTQEKGRPEAGDCSAGASARDIGWGSRATDGASGSPQVTDCRAHPAQL